MEDYSRWDIKITVPTNSDYYGPEAGEREAKDGAARLVKIYEAIAPLRFPNARIEVKTVPETCSYGNRSHIYPSDGPETDDMKIELGDFEEHVWQVFGHLGWHSTRTICQLKKTYG